MGRLRVLVVDDSATVRARLAEALAARPGEFELVGLGADGGEAVELCLRLKPDVVSLDLAMPGMGGLAATERIMAYRPTPILVVSASTDRGESLRTRDALAAGAVDVLEKPRPGEDAAAWDARFAESLRMAARVRVVTHLRARLGRPRARPAAPTPRAVLLGASTGGPGALRYLLRALPSDFPLPLVLVLHLAPDFASSLAEWLDDGSPVRVAFARDGQPLPPRGSPAALLAPPGRHLVVRRGRLRLDDGPELHSCRPSVDRLFLSAAEDLGSAAVGVLLTGMGRDGAAGLLELRRRGSLTVAQDEATSVVHGMPREAAALGAAQHILPLEGIAQLLAGFSGGSA